MRPLRLCGRRAPRSGLRAQTVNTARVPRKLKRAFAGAAKIEPSAGNPLKVTVAPKRPSSDGIRAWDLSESFRNR
jgi:hypothetical protein